MDESPSYFESALVDLRGMSLEKVADSDDSVVADAVERLLREARNPGQATAGFQSSM
jgi:FXSXX-COOH protein